MIDHDGSHDWGQHPDSCHDCRQELARDARIAARLENPGTKAGQPRDFGHGVNGYNRGCKCPVCREGARKHRARFPRLRVVAS